MSGSSASASSSSSAPASSAQQSCPLFATHFVRNGIFNYAIVQGDKSVQYATFSISERQSNSSIATRTYSGRADKPVALYQWTQEDAASSSGDAPETASDASSASAASYGGGNGLCFTFPVNKGCTYFIQIDFGLTSCAGGSSSTIHWFVDPNKRRLVPKGTAAAAASKKRLADNDAATAGSSSASDAPAASAAADPAAASAELSSAAAKKPRKAAAAAAAAGGKSSSAASKSSAGAAAVSVQA